MIKWNLSFPEGLAHRLLLVGSAPKGDHIAIDLKRGAVGYICHEQDWRDNPRMHFIAVSPSIGRFLEDISASPTAIPEDYWEAKGQ